MESDAHGQLHFSVVDSIVSKFPLEAICYCLTFTEYSDDYNKEASRALYSSNIE